MFVRPLVAPLWGNAYVLLFLTMTFWAGNAVAAKLGQADITPVTLTFLRWVGACLICYAVAHKRIHADWAEIRAQWLPLTLLGTIGFCGFNAVYYWALTYTTAINAAIIQAIMPVLIIAMNLVFFGMRARWLQVVGVVISIVGVAFIVARGDMGVLLALDFNQGDMLVLVAMLMYGGYAVGLRKKPPLHWVTLLFGLSFVALLMAVVLFMGELLLGAPRMPGPDGWLVVAYVSIFPSLLAQMFFIRSIELIGANRAGAYVNLTPILGSLMAIAFLGEVLHWFHVLAITLVFAGIGLAEKFRAT